MPRQRKPRRPREIWVGNWLIEPLPRRQRGSGWYMLLAEDGTSVILRDLRAIRAFCKEHPAADTIPRKIRIVDRYTGDVVDAVVHADDIEAADLTCPRCGARPGDECSDERGIEITPYVHRIREFGSPTTHQRTESTS